MAAEIEGMLKLVRLLNQESITIVVSVIVLALLVKILTSLPAIAGYLENRNLNRFSNLERILGFALPELLRLCAVDTAEREAFRELTGITADGERRELFVARYLDPNRSLPFVLYKRAASLLKVKDGELVPQIGVMDWVQHYTASAMAIGICAFGILMNIVTSMNGDSTKGNLLMLIMMAPAFVVFTLTFPVSAAKRIEKELEEEEVEKE